ncbi:hypothetical protein RhiJN_21410 [Ceratobasidium sp. AG-Ba]|nr:hypothetical protein RhiJN_21410 [Ceratobasidium sp. AG-Ba]
MAIPSTSYNPTSGGPDGGDATTVQECLGVAAGKVGCPGFAEKPCICDRSGSFIAAAKKCCIERGCLSDAFYNAIGEHNQFCRRFKRAAITTHAIISDLIVGPTAQPNPAQEPVIRTSSPIS